MLLLVIISITCYALPAQLWPLFGTRYNPDRNIIHSVVSSCSFITMSGAFVIVLIKLQENIILSKETVEEDMTRND